MERRIRILLKHADRFACVSSPLSYEEIVEEFEQFTRLPKDQTRISYVGDDNELYEIATQEQYKYALENAVLNYKLELRANEEQVALLPGPFERPKYVTTVLTHCVAGTHDIVRLDVSTGIWTRNSISPVVCRGTNWTALNQNEVFFCGGYDYNQFLDAAWIIDFSQGTVMARTGMCKARYFHGIILFDSLIYVFGGSDTKVLKQSEFYSLNKDCWAVLSDMPISMSTCSA